MNKLSFFKLSVKLLIFSFSLSCIFTSCKTDNKVVSCFGKRKYTKGYYLFAGTGTHKMPLTRNTPEVLTDNIISKKEVENNSKGLNMLLNTAVVNQLKSTRHVFKTASLSRNLSVDIRNEPEQNTFQQTLLLGQIESGSGRHEIQNENDGGAIAGGIVLIILALLLGFFVFLIYLIAGLDIPLLIISIVAFIIGILIIANS